VARRWLHSQGEAEGVRTLQDYPSTRSNKRRHPASRQHASLKHSTVCSVYVNIGCVHRGVDPLKQEVSEGMVYLHCRRCSTTWHGGLASIRQHARTLTESVTAAWHSRGSWLGPACDRRSLNCQRRICVAMPAEVHFETSGGLGVRSKPPRRLLLPLLCRVPRLVLELKPSNVRESRSNPAPASHNDGHFRCAQRDHVPV
jgi:hypothetical protein